MIKFKTKFKVSIIIIGILIVTSCAVIRKATYPPDFTYLENKTVTSSMDRLAMSIDKIDRTLQRISLAPTAIQRDIIIAELNKMEEITHSLGAGTQTTNHLLLDQNIDQFRSDIINTRKSIESNDSNYYLAGKLNGSCAGCHILKYNNN